MEEVKRIMTPNMLSWIVAMSSLVNILMIQQKKPTGWLLSFFNNLLAIYLMMWVQLYGMAFVQVIFAGISLRGWYSWRRESA